MMLLFHTHMCVFDHETGLLRSHVGVMVISASIGEFEASFSKTGSFREQSQLAYAHGIRTLLIIVNKMDCTNRCTALPSWSREPFMEIMTETSKWLTKNG